MPWWQVAVATAALVAVAVAVWVTLEADFLAHPGWLAVQKADFILGPVFVGLYWLRQRPESRFGPLLLVFGAVGCGVRPAIGRATRGCSAPACTGRP